MQCVRLESSFAAGIMLNNLGPVGKLVGTAPLIDAKVFSVGGDPPAIGPPNGPKLALPRPH